MKHGTSPPTGSSGGEPGATDWSVRGNGENTTKRRPGLEHPGQRREYDKKTPRIGASGGEWSTALALGLDLSGGRTKCHGLEHPRQRREYIQKTPRIGATGAE